MGLILLVRKVFIFEVDGVRVSTPRMYKQEPSKEQVLKEMQEWFFENYNMWFAIKENGITTNLEDWL